MVFTIILSFFFALSFSAYYGLNPKIEVILFLIPFTIFSFALYAALTSNISIARKQKGVFIAAILFGLFSGMGFSSGFSIQIGSQQSKLILMLETVLGFGGAVFLMLIGILTLVLGLRKIFKLSNRIWVLGASIVVASISLPMLLIQMFN